MAPPMKRSIHAMIIGIMKSCPICGIYRTLQYFDDELGEEFCCGCLEDVESADNELNRARIIQIFPHKSESAYELRRPEKGEVFND